MSNTTLTNIQILRSAVPNKRPDPGFLLDGQLALNYKDPDPGLFAKLQNGDLIKIGPATITSTGQAPNATPDAGGHPGHSVSEQWFDMRGAFYSPIMKTWDGTAWFTNNGFQVDDATGDFTLLKTLTVGIINADSGTISGQLNVGGNFLPNGTQCVHDLGAPGERWKGLYACSGDVSGHFAIGGGATVSGGLNVGGDISNNGDLDVLGSVTFGQLCSQGQFTVKTPTFLNCDVEILGSTQAIDLDLDGSLTVQGDVTLGRGCGVTSLTVLSDTEFRCNVQFNAYPLTFEHIIVTGQLESLGDTIIGNSCADDTLTVTAVSTFNCLTELEGETRVGRVSGQPFRTFGPNVFQQDLDGKADLLLVGKGYSAVTVDSDPFNTMVTKQWAEQHVAKYATQWTRTGQTIHTTENNITVVPQGNAQLGLTSDRWSHIYTNALTVTNKATSEPTVDGDSGTTLVTKDYLLSKTGDTDRTFKGDTIIGDGCGSSTINLNGATTLSCDMLPSTDVTINLGSTAKRFANIYTGDLHLRNDRGDWTLIEEPDALTMRNNITGKVYNIMMTERAE